MYSTHNEGKYVVAKRFIRTLKNKTYKYITSTSKNVYIDKLDDIVDEYNNITGKGHDYTSHCLLDYPYFKQLYNDCCRFK